MTTIDTRTEAERRYDALKDGSAYAKPAADELAYNPSAFKIDRLADAYAAAIVAQPAPVADPRDGILIGYIDGLPVLADYMTDVNDPDEDDLSTAAVVWQGIEISTDGHSYLSLPMDGGFVGDMELAQWQDVKRVAATDIPERLIALAQRYPRLRDVPMLIDFPRHTPPAAPAVRIEPHICDDEMDARLGQHIWTDYIAGTGDDRVELTVNADGRGQPVIFAFKRDEVDAQWFERVMHNALALFADPRVKAAREVTR